MKINYKHLHYFWVIASEGGISRAAESLHLTPQTLSGQLKTFEEAIGHPLFTREGRQLVLTTLGREVLEYAEQMFLIGSELESIFSHQNAQPRRLTTGITDAFPKLMAHGLLAPMLQHEAPVRLTCHEGSLEELLLKMGGHRLDLVLADAPATPSQDMKLHSHRLGECGTTFFATPELVQRYHQGFPHTLTGAPMLLPTRHSGLRGELEQWFHQQQVRPLIRGEFDDQALIKTFGQAGCGIFSTPSVIEADVCHHYRVEVVGRVESLRTGFYLITSESSISHPTIRQLYDHALEWFQQRV